MQLLSINKEIKEITRCTLGIMPEILKKFWVPIIAYCVCNNLVDSLVGYSNYSAITQVESMSFDAKILIHIIFNLVMVCFLYVPLFITVQRYVINNKKIKNFLSYWQDKEIFYFLLFVIKTSFFCLAVFVFVSFAIGIMLGAILPIELLTKTEAHFHLINMVISIILSIIILNCSGYAIGDKCTMLSGWNMARKNILRLFVIYLPFIVLTTYLPDLYVYIYEMFGIKMIAEFIAYFIQTLSHVLWSTQLAVVYRSLVKHKI